MAHVGVEPEPGGRRGPRAVPGDSVATRAASVDTLVTRAQNDDRTAFEEIVRRTHDRTYTLALRLTSNPHDARDVTQETYLRVYRSLPKFRADATFATWLHRITANCAADQLKGRARHRHAGLDELEVAPDEDPTTDPVAGAHRSGLRHEIEAALGRLAPKLRAVVVLRDIYDLAHADIADELGITVATAKVRLHRGRRQLRADLFDAGFEPEVMP